MVRWTYYHGTKNAAFDPVWSFDKPIFFQKRNEACFN